MAESPGVRLQVTRHLKIRVCTPACQEFPFVARHIRVNRVQTLTRTPRPTPTLRSHFGSRLFDIAEAISGCSGVCLQPSRSGLTIFFVEVRKFVLCRSGMIAQNKKGTGKFEFGHSSEFFSRTLKERPSPFSWKEPERRSLSGLFHE